MADPLTMTTTETEKKNPKNPTTKKGTPHMTTLKKDTSKWRDDPVLATSYGLYLSLIPARAIFDGYADRSIMGWQDLSLFHVARDDQYNVLLTGPTGPGKTHSVLAYGAREREAVAILSCNGAADPRKWKGKYVPTPDGGLEWHDGTLTSAVRFGGIVLADEINMLRQDLAADLFTILRQRFMVLEDKDDEVIHAPHAFEAHEHVDECGGSQCPFTKTTCDVCHDVRKGLSHERYEAGHRLLVMAACNTRGQGNYEGTRTLNDALKNRFAMHIEWGYDREPEEQLVDSHALLDLAAELRKGVDEGVLVTPTSTNALQEFESIARRLGLRFAIGIFLNRFNPEERDPVEKTVNLHYANLEKFFGPDDDDDETDLEGN